MKARVQVYDQTGITYAGLLPVTGLSFSEEVGGAGTCTFEALKADLDALSAWDSVIKIGLEAAPDAWFIGPCYVMRKVYSHRVGTLRYSFTCRSLLEAWADETVLLPEYIVDKMVNRVGTERGLGWMSTAYPVVPADWTLNYVSTRSTYPPKWPTASGAVWINASTIAGRKAKFFRSSMSVPSGGPKIIQFWLSADESATLWVAGEKIIETSSSETGYETFQTAKRTMYPGTYAVGIYTVTDDTNSSGGLPDDPVVMAAAVISSTGAILSWPERTSAGWWATRRAEEPPGDIPPGPTPGQMIQGLTAEARERNATGWVGVTQSFTGVLDSYGVSWGSLDIVERMYQYGTTTYWAIFQAFAESDECDVWMTNLTLHCAPRQGQVRSLTFTEEHLSTLGTTGTEGSGTWVVARAHSGWIQNSVPGPRREYSLEVGQSVTTAVAGKVSKASLRDAHRVDASGSMNPPQPGWMPYIDFKVGDIVMIRYPVAAESQYNDLMSITSISATAGEGGLLWDLEFSEYPPPVVP